MDQLGLSEEEREGRRKKLDQIETQFLRARRIRLTKDTFQTIKVIGRGSFGEVSKRKLDPSHLCARINTQLGSSCADAGH